MKKWMAGTMAALLAVSMAGCGTAQAETMEPAADPAGRTVQAEPVAAANPGTAESKVLLDQGGVRITALGYDPDGMLGARVPLRVENESDRDVAVQAEWGALNGCVMDALCYMEADAGQTVEDSVLFISTEVRRAGADPAGQVTLQLNVLDQESCETLATTGLVTWDLTGSGGETAVPQGVTLSDEGDVVVTACTADDEVLGSELRLWVENRSGRTVTVRFDEVRLGWGLGGEDTIAELLPGTCSVNGVKLPGNAADAAGKTLHLKLSVMDSDSYEMLTEQTVDVKLA